MSNVYEDADGPVEITGSTTVSSSNGGNTVIETEGESSE